MSVQFGICNFDGKPVDPEALDKVRPALVPYGPDGEGYICQDNLGVVYRALHTTKESRREVQPCIIASGAVLTWDGRLDNREELISLLPSDISLSSTDVEIVAASYEHWGSDAFAKLIGDWALSISDLRTRSVILAKDFVGTRHLYYSVESNRATWCTVLDPLLWLENRSFEIEEEYMAGWLSYFPAAELTPYRGILSVPPSSFVRITAGGHRTFKYWDFDPNKRLRYQRDSEYEEHFRDALARSVTRRLRSDSPVLAELSGGMDSSSIVCMADKIIAESVADVPNLHTVSYYDDSEPNWNECPYFAVVEASRGAIGCHIDVCTQPTTDLASTGQELTTLPAAIGCAPAANAAFAACLRLRGSRVVLSGIGGDEATGGRPVPEPELADSIASLRPLALGRQLKAWALSKRQPWILLLFRTVRSFFPPQFAAAPYMIPASVLDSEFVHRNRPALCGYPQRIRVLGSLPSFQENLLALGGLRRQLGCAALEKDPPFEKRYPYLDRTFLEFLYAIPRDQLVRPGQRRSLMRRALAGTVPVEVLNRRRKAYSARTPRKLISAAASALVQEGQLVRLRIIDSGGFLKSLEKLQRGEDMAVVPFLRILTLETWLRQLDRHIVLQTVTVRSERQTAENARVSAEKIQKERR